MAQRRREEDEKHRPSPHLSTTSRPGPRSRAYIESREATPQRDILKQPLDAHVGNVNYKGKTITVEYLGDNPSKEEEAEIANAVFGSGLFSKQHLSDVGGAGGSLAGQQVAKRSYADLAQKGLAGRGLGNIGTMPLRLAKAAGAPVMATGAGVLGATLEGVRQAQVPSQVGRFRITNVQEPKFLGMSSVNWDPSPKGFFEKLGDYSALIPSLEPNLDFARKVASGDPLTRQEMMLLRGVEQAGGDVIGAGVTGLGALAGKGLYGLGMWGKPVPESLAETKLPRNLLARLGIGGRTRPATALETTMRLGEEGKRGATGWGRAPRGRVPPDSGEALPLDPAMGGGFPLPMMEPITTKPGQSALRDVPRAMSWSRSQSDKIISPISAVPVQNMDYASIGHDIYTARGPKGQTLAEWLDRTDVSGLISDPKKKEFRQLPKRMKDLIQRYMPHAEKGIQGMAPPKVPPTIKNIRDDVRFLEDYLDPLYNQMKGPAPGSANAQLLIAQAMRDALQARIDRTVQQVRPDLFKPWKAQNEYSRALGRAVDMVKGSPDTLISGLGLGVMLAPGAAATMIDPMAALAAAPLLLAGASPPAAAKAGQRLYQGRLSTIPQNLFRLGRIGTQRSAPLDSQLGREDQPPAPPNLMRRLMGGF